MYLNTEIKIDFTPLNELIESHKLPRDGYTHFMMNDYTVHALTGKHFYDDRRQTYYGYEILEGRYCKVGEVVVLANYEKMKE